MERPSTNEISNTFQHLESLYYDLERYCDYLQHSIDYLSAYLEDSLDRVNPTLDEEYIKDVKEILNVR